MTDISAPPRLSAHNNYNAIRTIAALAVVCAHSRELSGAIELGPISPFSLLAVQAFFVISGFLIVQSYDRSSNLASYARKRILRVYPAYFLVVTACTIGLSQVSGLSVADYFGSQTLRYLVSNLLFLNFIQPDLPGVFSSNPTNAVNGALWTLKIEVAFYIFAPLLVGAIRRTGSMPILFAVFLMSAIYNFSVTNLELQRQFPGQLTYFAVGAACYFHKDKLINHLAAVAIAGVALYMASNHGLSPVLRPIGIGLIVFAAAYGPYVDHMSRYGDPSYGLYIIHYPVIQLLIAGGYFANPWLGVALTLAIVVPAAFLMWHGVEKHFLARRSSTVATCRGRVPY